MKIRSLNPSDLLLLETARSVITSRFDSDRFRHTVAASARMASGRVVSAVNVFATCGSGPCAEAVLLGMAATEDERDARVIVAVGGPDQGFPVLAPCGNCRQLLSEYAPHVEVIVLVEGALCAIPIADLLPYGYEMEVG